MCRRELEFGSVVCAFEEAARGFVLHSEVAGITTPAVLGMVVVDIRFCPARITHVSFDTFDFLPAILNYVVHSAIHNSFKRLRDIRDVGMSVCRSFAFNNFNTVCAVGMMLGDVLVVVLSVGIEVQGEDRTFG